MRLSLFLYLQLSGALALRTRQDGAKEQGSVRVTNRFIVEVGAGESLDAASSKITKNGGTILKTFDSDVFSGFSLESDSDNVDTLQQIGEVAMAWPMTEVKLSPFTPEASFSDDAAAANYSVHAYTGVEEVHKAGIFGKGVTIAIVDTGISYDHPALGGGIGPGYKITYGHDFVGDGLWPDEGDKVPDEDPMDHVGHGTHVAGIIAGKSEWFTGVAPEATLMSYKVFTEAGGTDDATLIDAFLSAYKKGVDIITASIGGPSGWHTNPWAVVASRIVDQGVVITISAGNSGQDGPFYASSGSSGKNVLAIASLDPTVLSADPFQATFTLDGTSNTTNLAYRAGNDPWDVKGLKIVPLTLETTPEADGCSALPSTADFSDAIALVRRGGCTFEQKQGNLQKAGAKNVLFYNTDIPLVAPSSPSTEPNIGMIEKKAGEAIIATVKAGGTVTADFSMFPDFKVGASNSAGGVPSEFTSWGGSFDLDIKPDIGAPGGSILATYLDKSYAVLSGTSMACPYVAGVVALYISKFGGRDVHGPGFAKKLVNRIIASGNSVPWQVEHPVGLPVNYGFWAPVMQVGTGLINAQTVLNAETSLEFEKFALNDTHHFSRYQKVHITNDGEEPVTYTFKLQPAGSFNAQSDNPSFVAHFLELAPYEFVPEVSFPNGKFTLQPGETKTAQFNFEPPKGLDESQMPSYSGKILITGSNGDQLSVPYMGAGFNLHEKMRGSMFSDSTPYQVAGVNRDDIGVHHSYTFDVNRSVQDFPKIYIELKWGTKELRWDIFEAGWKEHNWKYPPVIGQNGYVGAATYWNQSNYGYRDFDPDTYDKEATSKFPEPDLYRNSYWSGDQTSFWWLGKLANGSYIQPGKYTMRFAALIPFGEPVHSDNWDIWETPEIQVLPREG